MTDDYTQHQGFKPTPAHQRLAAMTGDWAGITKVWFEPDKIGDESPVSGQVRSLLDGRFIIWDYQGSLGGKPLAGMFTIGWHVDRQRFEASWIDSFHTGSAIMACLGEAGADAISVLCHYGPPGGEWGWRTELALQDSGELLISAWNIEPTGQAHPALETKLHRT